MNEKKRFVAVLAVAAVLAAAVPVMATNGMYLTAYGPETLGRAGANLGISDRTLAINFNPGGITQMQGHHFSANLAVLMPQLEYGNMLNEQTDGSDRQFPLPSFAYVSASKNTGWAWGIGLIAQGGMGATFRDLNTPFGTQDKTYSEVRFGTLTPTVAYAFNDKVSLGFTANIGYADASFELYPETSFFNQQAPEQSFFGINMKKAGGLQYNGRLGLFLQPHPKFSMGLVYQSETQSNYENGDMWVNFTNHPMLGDTVRYEAEMDGFTFAAQAGIGFGFRPSEKVVVALDIKRYFWDDAIDTITVTAKNPGTAGAPPEVVLPFVFDWEDQWVVALGLDWRVNDAWTVRFGYNYGENPVPDETVTPLFPAIVENHLAAGFSFLKRNTTWSFALQHAFENSQTNNNPNPQVNPFGPGSTVDHAQWTFAFGASWVLDR